MSGPLQFIDMPNSPLKTADLLILPIPLERTVSFKPGTALAPKAILDVSSQLEYYEEDAGWSPFKYMSLHVLPEFADDPLLEESALHEQLTQQVASLPAEKFFVALGGEHSLTPSLVKARMQEPGTVLFLDAHADLRESYEGSRYSHACPVNRLLEQNHDIILAGIRSIFETEAEKLNSTSQITLFLDSKLQRQERWRSFLQKISSLEGALYLSIDMDVFDPAVVPGVGTPQPGGMTWYQLMELLETLFANENIELRGVDLVELVPEPSRVSEMTAAKLLMKIISYWGIAQRFQQGPQKGSQLKVDYE